jgi:hypothetical protein
MAADTNQAYSLDGFSQNFVGRVRVKVGAKPTWEQINFFPAWMVIGLKVFANHQ